MLDVWPTPAAFFNNRLRVKTDGTCYKKPSAINHRKTRAQIANRPPKVALA